MPETLAEENITAESTKDGFAEGLASSVPVALEGPENKAVSFVAEFRERYGRAPRVLHIGNIANNAYGNALLLNEVGFDCDVLCYDYYHIMGCPEWNDADFEGEVEDQFFPDWTSVNLKGYRRPDWFVQGPFQYCIKYLQAKRQGRPIKKRYYWRVLALQCYFICGNLPRRMKKYHEHLRSSLLKVLLQRFVKTLIEPRRITECLGTLLTLLLGVLLIVPAIVAYIVMLPFCFLSPLIRQRLFRRLFYNEKEVATRDELMNEKNLSRNEWLQKHYEKIVKEFAEKFPQHKYALAVDDIIRFKHALMKFNAIFRYYDIIHGYATDPIYPLLLGNKPYVAYEHGTIRDIPFENSAVGKLTLLAYSRASALFLTNADNLPKARLMQSDDRRIIKGLHKFDERRIYAQLEKIKHYPREQGRFGFADDVTVFFAPARQDHQIKGNDHILYAAQKVYQQVGNTFKVVFAAWGPDKPLAEKLVEELGIEKIIHWVEPLGTKELLNAYRSVDAVLDQFVLPCIGGLPVEVMVVGECPVITYLDDELMAEFYGETIPLLNAHSPDEVAQAMLLVMQQPERVRQVVADCVGWVNRCHTHLNLLDQLADAYRLTGVLDAPAEKQN